VRGRARACEGDKPFPPGPVASPPYFRMVLCQGSQPYFNANQSCEFLWPHPLHWNEQDAALQEPRTTAMGTPLPRNSKEACLNASYFRRTTNPEFRLQSTFARLGVFHFVQVSRTMRSRVLILRQEECRSTVAATLRQYETKQSNCAAAEELR
jgi:hypothetical protein